MENSMPLVSMIIPCYNVRHKMQRMLESILRQTYRHIEVIFVDDGSTDGTGDFIASYRDKLVGAGIEVSYFYQENRGQAVAVNRGLKKMRGDYLVWPDADDWLSDNSIEKRLRFLESHPEYGIVTSNAYVYDEKDTTCPIGKIVSHVTDETKRDNQFELLLRYRSVFCDGCHMVRMSAFREANPQCDIYEGCGGQNFQMLLPVYYRYKRYFLDEPLYHYVIYADSHSRGDDTLEKKSRRLDGLLDIILNTLARIPMSPQEREKYEKIAEIDDAKQRLDIAFRYGDKALLESVHAILRDSGTRNQKQTIQYLIGKNELSRRLCLSVIDIMKSVKRSASGRFIQKMVSPGGGYEAEYLEFEITKYEFMYQKIIDNAYLANAPLVSMIIPCYNVRHKMQRMLESLLRQTYRHIEVIFVDDGSTDGTRDFIASYRDKLVGAGIEVSYFYQENCGLGGAINRGLKEIHGNYLMWPDPDDWLSDDSVEKKLRFLESHPEYGVVTSNAYVYNEKDFTRPVGKVVRRVTEETKQDNQFELLLRYRSVFCPGCHMIRMSAFREANSQCDIYEGCRGQNFQMLLPVYYRYKRYFLDEPLYHYVIYADSMSRGDDTLEKSLRRLDELLDIILNTLARIPMSPQEREKYEKMAEIDDAKQRLDIAFRYGDKALLETSWSKLRAANAINRKLKARYMLGKNEPLRRIFLLVNAGVKDAKSAVKRVIKRRFR